ncbi:hypothetical protein HAX54_001398 [Datura stramonium]|uniref:Uncharacterized protein n=1 Tax=Datura stramonium TaxID=4076 RepID=A0ABS8T379_DATST|nr:hypothetical protein [Datura stramonium]
MIDPSTGASSSTHTRKAKSDTTLLSATHVSNHHIKTSNMTAKDQENSNLSRADKEIIKISSRDHEHLANPIGHLPMQEIIDSSIPIHRPIYSTQHAANNPLSTFLYKDIQLYDILHQPHITNISIKNNGRIPIPTHQKIFLLPVSRTPRFPSLEMNNSPQNPSLRAHQPVLFATQPVHPLHQPQSWVEMGLQGQAVIFTMEINGVETMIVLRN